MTLPADARRRWGLTDGGEVGFIDLGNALLLVPSRVAEMRRELWSAINESDWAEVRSGFGDPDLADQ